MDSREEGFRSTADHHADDNPRSLLASREGRGDSQIHLVQKCSLLAPILTEMIPGEAGWATTIHFTGGRSAYNVVDEAS
jgi:hypothetical protein